MDLTVGGVVWFVHTLPVTADGHEKLFHYRCILRVSLSISSLSLSFPLYHYFKSVSSSGLRIRAFKINNSTFSFHYPQTETNRFILVEIYQFNTIYTHKLIESFFY